MSKTNNFIFNGLRIVAWVVFVGLCVQAGGLIVNFFFSLYKPEVVPRLYEKLDLSEMYEKSKYAFYSMYNLIIGIALLKAVLFYQVILLMHKLDLSNPFNPEVAKRILRLSHFTLAIGLISYAGRQLAKNFMHKGFSVGDLNQFWSDSQAFILMGAVIYIIATIFNKGVELQTESELTV